MPRRRTTAAARRSNRRPRDFSTAFLLPDLHPWLKEFFADRNLIPVRDEVWGSFPVWEPMPAPAGTDIQYSASSIEYDGTRAPSTTSGAAISAPSDLVPVTPLATIIETSALLETRQPIDAVPNTRYQIPDTKYQIPADDVRRSAAPVPFVIPVDASATTPSRHYLRLAPRHTTQPKRAPTPNFIASSIGSGALDAARTQQRARPAPMLHIPSPYDELLIVNIVLGPLGVLWRSIGWPLWTALRIPHPGAFLWSCRLQAADWTLRRRPLEALFRMSLLQRDAARPLRVTPTLLTSRLRPAFAWASAGKPALAFAAVLVLVLLPVKLLNLHAGFSGVRGRVLSATAEAYTTFQSGGAALSHSSFEEAITAFDRARTELEDLPRTTGTLPRLAFSIGSRLPGLQSTLGRADDGRKAGIALADASSAAARGLAMLEDLDLTSSQADAFIDAATASFASARMFAEDARERLQNAAPQLIPTIDRAIGELRRQERLLPILRALGGIDRSRRIFLIFQNPAELRPTGGFIGSVALVDVASGRVESLELPGGGSYDISGVARIRVIPPDPLRLLAETWQFHDANWFPDFPTSARKLREFFGASGGPTVDAIVAINAPILERLLAITGPIRIGERSFSASDATAALTDIVESADARATNEPKAILQALAPEVLRRLLTITERGAPQARIQLLDELLRALEERDIILAFTDDAIQRIVADARWAGAIRPIDRDGLFVVHANIGGGKSDAAIQDDVTHTATILDDGSVVDTVTITRAHTGGISAATTAPSERLRESQNVDFVRVYVPHGAELLAADGFESPPAAAFAAIPTDAIPDRLLLATSADKRTDPATGIEITEELGRTVFGGWLQIPAGETRTARLVYRLPWRYQRTAVNALGKSIPADPQSYSIAIQKQSGTRPTIRHTVELAPRWRATWVSENLRSVDPTTCLRTEASCLDAKVWTLEDILTTDLFSGMMVAPKARNPNGE